MQVSNVAARNGTKLFHVTAILVISVNLDSSFFAMLVRRKQSTSWSGSCTSLRITNIVPQFRNCDWALQLIGLSTSARSRTRPTSRIALRCITADMSATPISAGVYGQIVPVDAVDRYRTYVTSTSQIIIGCQTTKWDICTFVRCRDEAGFEVCGLQTCIENPHKVGNRSVFKSM